MEVETYEIEEMTDRSTAAIDEEAISLARELGLGGQEYLIKNTDNGETRIPYPRMTAGEVRVYETLYPTKTKVEAYNAGIIPVRVLEVIKHSRDLFQYLYVWHVSQHDPDPILVGAGPSYQEYFLLARWGDALEQMPALEKRALKKLTADWKSLLKIKKAEVETFGDSLEANAQQHLAGQSIFPPF